MKPKHIENSSTQSVGTERESLHALSDQEIRAALDSDPDVLPTDARFWKDARVVLPRSQPTVDPVRSLSSREVKSIADWAAQFAEAAEGRPVDYSDAWSEEDQADALAASLRTIEDRETRGE